MTGKAEEGAPKPDPKNPTLHNGDFEQVFGDPPQVVGWHYQRQLEVVTADDAPSGKRYVRFHNAESGRYAQALQVFGVDGRYVRQLQISLRVRYRNVQPDPTAQQTPLVEVQFYDENRATTGDQTLGSARQQRLEDRIQEDHRARACPGGADPHRTVWGHGRTIAGRRANERLAVGSSRIGCIGLFWQKLSEHVDVHVLLMLAYS